MRASLFIAFWGLCLQLTALPGAVPASELPDTMIVPLTAKPLWGGAVVVSETFVVDPRAIVGITGVDALAVGAGGEMFCYDADAGRVVRLDSSGGHVGEVGGEGDVEARVFERLSGLRVMSDGGVAVFEPSRRRVAVFSNDDEMHVDAGSGLHGPNVFWIDREDDFYVMAVAMSHDGPSFRVNHVSSSGQLVREIPVPGPSPPSKVVRMTPDGPRPNFAQETCFALDNDGNLVLGWNGAYSIECHERDGLVRRLERSGVDPISVGAEERAEWVAWADMAFGSPIELPVVKPVFRGFFVDCEDRLWVERYVVARPDEIAGSSYEWREATTYDVVAFDGTFFGSVEIPQGTVVYHVDDMSVWGIRGGKLVVKLEIVSN